MSMYHFVFSALAIIALNACSKSDKACKDEAAKKFEAEVNMENDHINIENTKKYSNAHSGDYYSSVDSVQTYGAGYVKTIADSLKGYNLTVYVTGWLREKEAPFEGSIAVSMNDGGNVLDWKCIELKNKPYKAGEWIMVKDSFNYPPNLFNRKDVQHKVFSFKRQGADALDADDIHITYKFYK